MKDLPKIEIKKKKLSKAPAPEKSEMIHRPRVVHRRHPKHRVKWEDYQDMDDIEDDINNNELE